MTALLAPVDRADGQQWPPAVVTGTRVRLPGSTPELPLKGVLIASTPDSVRVSLASGSAMAFPVRELAWIDVSEGRPRARRALIGFAIGGLGGLFIGEQLGKAADPEFGAIFGSILGGTIGAIGGGVFGAVRAPDRWRRHHNPR